MKWEAKKKTRRYAIHRKSEGEEEGYEGKKNGVGRIGCVRARGDERQRLIPRAAMCHNVTYRRGIREVGREVGEIGR